MVALTSIIYGVLTGAGDEGFGKASDGTVLKLDRSDIPLICFYDETVSEKDIACYDEARHVLQEMLGCRVLEPCQPWDTGDKMPLRPERGMLFLRVDDPPIMQSQVSVSSPYDPQAMASTFLFHQKGEGLRSAVIYLNPETPWDLRSKIWFHEMGHSLGLGHDRIKGSIMYPSVSDRKMGLSKRDASMLQGAYCL